MYFCTLHNENLYSGISFYRRIIILDILSYYFYICTQRTYAKNGFITQALKRFPILKFLLALSFSSLKKNKVQAFIPVAVDGNESDIVDGGDESDGSIESETKEEVVESETEEDTEERDSYESEDDATGSAANGRNPKVKAKDKKANLSWSKGKWALPKESSLDEIPL